MFVEENLYRPRHVDTFHDGHHIHYEIGNWLFERKAWGQLLGNRAASRLL